METKERKPLVKEKIFWLLASVTIIWFIGLIYQNEYLQMPFGVTIAAFIPGIFIIGVSPGFAVKFVKIHKYFHKKIIFHILLMKNYSRFHLQ